MVSKSITQKERSIGFNMAPSVEICIGSQGLVR